MREAFEGRNDALSLEHVCVMLLIIRISKPLYA